MAEETRTEVMGGPIPKTTDEWKSRAQWEEFNRRQETERGLRDVAALKRQAEADRAQAVILDQQQRIATGYKDLAAAEGAQAVGEAQLVADQHRSAATLAAAAVERLEREVGEDGLLSRITQAQLDQRTAQIQEVALDAATAIEETNLASAREEAELSVVAAARGAGGSAVEQLTQDLRGAAERKVGRIGTKAEIQQQRLKAGKRELRERAAVEMGRMYERLAGKREDAALGKRRADLIEEGIPNMREKARLRAAGFEAQAAGFGLDATAARDSAIFGDQAAAQGLNALVNRPPIPDWNAIGRKQERANRWQRASGIVSTVTNILSWF